MDTTTQLSQIGNDPKPELAPGYVHSAPGLNVTSEVRGDNIDVTVSTTDHSTVADVATVETLKTANGDFEQLEPVLIYDIPLTPQSPISGAHGEPVVQEGMSLTKALRLHQAFIENKDSIWPPEGEVAEAFEIVNAVMGDSEVKPQTLRGSVSPIVMMDEPAFHTPVQEPEKTGFGLVVETEEDQATGETRVVNVTRQTPPETGAFDCSSLADVQIVAGRVSKSRSFNLKPGDLKGWFFTTQAWEACKTKEEQVLHAGHRMRSAKEWLEDHGHTVTVEYPEGYKFEPEVLAEMPMGETMMTEEEIRANHAKLLASGGAFVKQFGAQKDPVGNAKRLAARAHGKVGASAFLAGAWIGPKPRGYKY